MSDKEIQARRTLARCTIKQLIDLWNETEKKIVNMEVAMVRGWIMDSLQAKNPTAFDSWMLCDDGNDKPERFFAEVK